MTETVCTRKESIILGTVKDPLQHLGDLTGPGGAQNSSKLRQNSGCNQSNKSVI